MPLKIRSAEPPRKDGEYPEVKAVGIVRAVRIGDRHMDSYVEFNNNRTRIYCNRDEAMKFVELVGAWVEAGWRDYKLQFICNSQRERVYDTPTAQAS